MFKNVKQTFKNKTKQEKQPFHFHEKITKPWRAQTDISGNGSQREQFACMKPVFCREIE